MTLTKRFVLPAALAVLTSLSAAQAVSYKIASVGPLSGDQSMMGTTTKNGVEMAIQDKAADLKQAGIEVSLAAFDDQSSPSRGLQVAKEILANKAIIGVIGANNSSVSNVLGEAFASERLAIISPNSTNDALTQHGWTHFNRVGAPNSAQIGAAASYISGVLTPKSVYVVSDNSSYGNSLSKGMIAAFKDYKIPVAGYAGAASPAEIELVIKKVKASGAPLVYFGGTYDVGGLFAKALRASGLSVQMMGADGIDSPSFIQRANNGAVGVLYTTTNGPVGSFSNASSFTAKYRAAYGAVPGGVAVYAYDATIVLLNALEAASANGAKPTRAQVSAAVRKVNLPACFSGDKKDCETITGAVSFTATGERTTSRLLMMKYDELFQSKMLKIQTVNAPDAK